MQVKIFFDVMSDKDINMWLEKNPNIKIHDIKCSCGEYSTCNIVLVVYDHPTNYKTVDYDQEFIDRFKIKNEGSFA